MPPGSRGITLVDQRRQRKTSFYLKLPKDFLIIRASYSGQVTANFLDSAKRKDDGFRLFQIAFIISHGNIFELIMLSLLPFSSFYSYRRQIEI